MLKKKVRYLAEARALSAFQTDQAKELDAALHRTELGRERKAAFDAVQVTREKVMELEAEVRELALTEHARTGSKKPAPGIVVKKFEHLEYSPDVAKMWCMSSYSEALRMDKRTFEKVARVLKPDFVSVQPELKATIARDLSSYLAEEGGAE